MSLSMNRIGGQNPPPKPLKLWEKCVGCVVLCIAVPCAALWLVVRSIPRPRG